MPNMRPRHCQSWRDAQQRSYGPTRKLCLLCTLKASVKNAKDCGSRKNDARLTAASRLLLDDDACEREGQDGDLVLVRLHNGFCASISACRNPRKLFLSCLEPMLWSKRRHLWRCYKHRLFVVCCPHASLSATIFSSTLCDLASNLSNTCTVEVRIV